MATESATIVQRLWNYCNVLRDDGVSYGDYVEQLTYLYSNFQVGAALLTKSGKVFTGCNVENASYGGTICAERTAITKAVSEGEKEFEAIAIVLDSDEAGSPCGFCRRFLVEFGLDIRVIMATVSGDVKEDTIGNLLPLAFTSASLK